RLRILSVTGLAIDDDALPALAASRTLLLLDLSGTNVRDPSALTGAPRLSELGLRSLELSPRGRLAADALARRGVVVYR
nr:hypothetical protein [Kofleriaceae bacterium]